MKKFFLIPLMTLVCSVMAWGATRTAGTAAELRDAISAASDGDVIELTADIAYGSDHTLININKSITLDGKGHKITGYGMRDRLETAINDEAREVVVVVNHNAAASGLSVTIKNLKMIADDSGKFIALMVYDGVNTLTLDNCEITSTKGYPFVLYGETQDKLNLIMNNTAVSAGSKSNYLYAVLLQRPINANITNSTFEGYCTWYFLPPFSLNTPNQRWGTRFGLNNSGARGSVLSFDNCYFYADNVHSGATNEFGCFVFEEDGITLNLNNVGVNAESLGDAGQAMLLFNSWGPIERHLRKVEINMSGDNTHINGQFVANYWYTGYDQAASQAAGTYGTNRFRLENGALSKGTYEPEKAYKGVYYKDSIYVNISGGTYSMNPETYQIVMHLADKYFTAEGMADVNLNVAPWGDGEGGCKIHDDASVEKTYKSPTIATGYKVTTTNQGTITLYRVTKAADGTAINDNAGQNETKTIEVASGAEVKLNQPTTEAGYVQVKNDGSDATTVKVGKVENPGTPSETKVDQVLVVKNGLDVQGTSQVLVQAGSSLVVGEGGITTQSASSIVIEADKDGAASLLLHPDITVNQQPNLTVKMKAKNVGKQEVNAVEYRTWHRFAMPIMHADSWTKAPNWPTYLYGWDYENQDWYKLPGGVSDMVPFAGYTLSPKDEFGNIEYTFTGQLVGNTNQPLNFTKEGFNFFGNSYTGYIDILALVEQLTGAGSKFEATVWTWYGQHYHSVPLRALAEDPDNFLAEQKEIAPMQTFILRLVGADNAETTIDYRSAIWGNPRYSAATGVPVTPAPARRASKNNTFMRIVVTAGDEMDDISFLKDNRFSDEADNGYDATKYMNENAVNVYATVEGENYSAVASDELEGKAINLQTNEAVNYTFSFSNVRGEALALRDNVTNQVISIENGATYEFAAQPNSIVEGRFEIINLHKMPTSIENTEVKANAKGIYTIMGQYLGEDFEALPAGVYVVNGVKIVK